MNQEELVGLFREAVRCRACFQDLGVTSARVDLAQPRWVGEEYWSIRPRVAVVMLNPGGGQSYSELTARHLVELLTQFSLGTANVEAVYEQQRVDMPNWGRGGNFLRFYLNGFGLRLRDIAFANIAWCATQGDKYPYPMLRRCYERHTRRLLELLDPNIVLLSGSKTHEFAGPLAGFLPLATIVPTLHYAHRGGARTEAAEFDRVRALLAASRSRFCRSGE
jgi:hypothetical protein